LLGELDERLSSVFSFGEADDTPAIIVTMRDVRCSMERSRLAEAPKLLFACCKRVLHCRNRELMRGPEYLCAAGVPDLLAAMDLSRLTVGKQEGIPVLKSSALLCASRVPISELHSRSQADRGYASFVHYALLRLDAAWPRLVRSLGLTRRCRAKP